MSENRRIENLVGAARDVLERRISLLSPAAHPEAGPKAERGRLSGVRLVGAYGG